MGTVLDELDGLTADTRRSLEEDNAVQVETTVRAARESAIASLQVRIGIVVTYPVVNMYVCNKYY